MEPGSVDGLTFAHIKEVKQTNGGKKYLKFFLVDTSGMDHLAAVGEDSGDAHYTYHSTKPFNMYGVLTGHNRKDLQMWLEMVIKESGKSKDGITTPDDIIHLGDPTPENPFGIFFVSYRQERAHLGDGRRCNKWYLVDQHGVEHLAVVGEERDTRDGHYQYVTEEPFATKYPLSCHNQAGVLHWIESMLTHYAPPGIQIDFRLMHKNSGELHPEQLGLPAGSHSHPPQEHGSSHVQGQQPGAHTTHSEQELTPYSYHPPPGPDHAAKHYTSASEVSHSAAHLTAAGGAGRGGEQQEQRSEVGCAQVEEGTAAVPSASGAGVGLSAHGGVSTPFGASELQQESSKPPKPLVLNLSRGKEGEGKRGPGRASGSKHKLVGIAHDAHLKRLRRLQAESEEAAKAAHNAHLAKLRHSAAAQATQREAVRRSVASWVRSTLSEDEQSVLSQWHETLKQVWNSANKESLTTTGYMPLRVPDIKALASQPSAPNGWGGAMSPTHPPHTAAKSVVLQAPGSSVLGPSPQHAHNNDDAAASTAAPTPAGSPGDGGTGAGTSNGAACGTAADRRTCPELLPWQEVSTWSYEDPHLQQHGVRLILECLREVGALCLPPQALVNDELVETVKLFQGHPHPAVRRLANDIIARWQRLLLSRISVLLGTSFVEDPVAQLEAKIKSKEIELPADAMPQPPATPAAGQGTPQLNVPLLQGVVREAMSTPKLFLKTSSATALLHAQQPALSLDAACSSKPHNQPDHVTSTSTPAGTLADAMEVDGCPAVNQPGRAGAGEAAQGALGGGDRRHRNGDGAAQPALQLVGLPVIQGDGDVEDGGQGVQEEGEEGEGEDEEGEDGEDGEGEEEELVYQPRRTTANKTMPPRPVLPAGDDEDDDDKE